ncbi:hypothetical protein ACN2XU_17490 [Primorskyibacter sp. 2E107]
MAEYQTQTAILVCVPKVAWPLKKALQPSGQGAGLGLHSAASACASL